MTKQEAIKIIATISDSIKKSPAQFQFNVSVVGTSVISTGGGVGMAVSATGGGAGSTTIGYNATMNNASVEIAMSQADAKITQRMNNLLQVLDSIMSELKSEAPNKSKLDGFLDNITKAWIPEIISSVVANAVIMAVGLN